MAEGQMRATGSDALPASPAPDVADTVRERRRRVLLGGLAAAGPMIAHQGPS